MIQQIEELQQIGEASGRVKEIGDGAQQVAEQVSRTWDRCDNQMHLNSAAPAGPGDSGPADPQGQVEDSTSWALALACRRPGRVDRVDGHRYVLAGHFLRASPLASWVAGLCRELTLELADERCARFSR